MDSKTIYIVLGALAVYFLFIRKPTGAVTPKYRPVSPPPPTTTQQYINTGVAALPALGTFLGNVFGGGPSSSSSSYSDSGSSYFTGGPSSITDDDSFDYSS